MADELKKAAKKNKGFVLATALKEWAAIRDLGLDDFFDNITADSLKEDSGMVRFDNADPGFLPLDTVINAAAAMIMREPHRVARYELPNDTDDFKVFVYPYLHKLGIQPPNEDTGFTKRNMTVGIGATHLFNLAVKHLVHQNETLLVTAPTYGLFSFDSLFLGVGIETVKLEKKDDWKINPDLLERRIRELKKSGKRVKAFLHINPSNPLGTIDEPERIKDIARVLIRNKVYAIDDLAYLGTEYPGHFTTPLSSVYGMQTRTVTLFSLSKSYCAPGLRSGMAVGPESMISSMMSHMLSGFEAPPITSQYALFPVFNDMPEFVKRRDEYLQANAREYQKRQRLVEALVKGEKSLDASAQENLEDLTKEYENNQTGSEDRFNLSAARELLSRGISGVNTLNTPVAGYFQVLDFSGVRGRYYQGGKIQSSMDLSGILAREAGVVFIPGEVMQFEGEEMVGRISYALSPAKIVDGLYKISKVIESFDK